MSPHQPDNDIVEVFSPFKVVIREPHVSSFRNNSSSWIKAQLLPAIITTQVHGHRMSGPSSCWLSHTWNAVTINLHPACKQHTPTTNASWNHTICEPSLIWMTSTLINQNSKTKCLICSIWFKTYKHYSHKQEEFPQKKYYKSYSYLRKQKSSCYSPHCHRTMGLWCRGNLGKHVYPSISFLVRIPSSGSRHKWKIC